jgi:signal transduction histidine kinase
MLRTLYARLSAALVLLFLIIGVIYALITTSTIERYMQEITQHFNRDLAQRIVADRQLVADGRLNDQALKATFNAYMEINPSIEIYLLDPDGRILAYSADPGKVKRQSVDLAPIRAFLRGEEFPLLGDDPRSHDRRKAFSVTPVPAGEMSAGYLYVVLRGEQYDSAEQVVQESYVFRFSAWALAGSLGFGLVAGLMLFHILTRRLQRLAGVMQGFQQSGFSEHSSFTTPSRVGSDEIDRLGATFDQMAQRIIAQWGELKRQDHLRRELVAQISHDLRTPLAVLHGYLETLQMKESDQASEEWKEFLAISLRQSERLKRMVEELFELAQLEARETRPSCEPVALPELVQDVVQKFLLQAESAAISLNMAPPPRLPLVSADVALTERVLDNLIANAIDHTPAGGHIDVRLQVEDESVQVLVADTGPGVPTADLPHIFEPFYRSADAGRSGAHAGLGLAIARRISELQGGTLGVKNQAEGGACFILTLSMVAS